ncbi:MAG: hypothetical protein UT24_C0009G0120 [Candidatus Woesebacteria bacterium GW2011_GWB1_39_12]|uniref:O-antigen ligase-related domain-containing protein n=2 Tax=Candidatus Woeseibacteriota TaxID=1752722 RepID=A0A0G0M367_9BACT|nr:MAG: hypothetical protein UT23_C0002G0118 [Candidatus Woesebacteria bacterium GW2011_GWA1_39_12]KKR00803.1 MAG: hypothetical protein UT24_C0009G0120 [Candidatus Woesebacteria bacterium GW2011_GWB1_39_12]
MVEKIKNSITVVYYLLFFSVPLIFHPQTSELFEFNKMVLTYALTTFIVSLWLIRMILEKKIIFRRTILDIPLIIFLISQFLSTLISIDSRTSLLGYYSRFHGGLASSLSYSLLYWAFVSNMHRLEVIKSIKILITSAFLISIWAIFEHFGRSFSCLLVPEFRSFDASCWVQDVQNRVYATLGQPNWLAAWIVALTPLTWGFALISNINPSAKFRIDAERSRSIKNQKSKLQSKKTNILKFVFWVTLSILFFSTLLFTKSRSGLLGFGVANLTFWALSFLFSLKHNIEKKHFLKTFVICNLAFVILALASGTPWTPNLKNEGLPAEALSDAEGVKAGPALEVGGSSSVEIRKIVWKGAIDIWKHYPILGTGVETFAFSYYNFRPVEHNLVSEWDFLYNKAHNEYLNYAATAGTVGLLAYLLLICFSVYQISNIKFLGQSPKDLSAISKQIPNSKSQLGQSEQSEISLLSIALLSGFISILMTNFFGFSVVPVALQFFLFPAFAITLAGQSAEDKVQRFEKIESSNSQKTLVFFVFCTMLFALFSIGKYWYGDFLYAKGKMFNDSQEYIKAQATLAKAAMLSPKESVYHGELADVASTLAIIAYEEGDEDLAKKFVEIAIYESDMAAKLSPANITLKRDRANMFIKLSIIDPSFLISARNTLIETVKFAPTEAKLSYNLGVTYLRTGDYEKAIEIIQKAVEMKPNYKEAHYALALLYIDKGEKEKAKEELLYILENISSNDPEVKRELDELGI